MGLTKMKDADLHNYPFDEEIFRRTFNGYVRRLHIISAVVILLICTPYIARAIAWYLEQTKVDITNFLRVWHAGETLLLDIGFPHVVFGIFASGIVSGGHFSFGIVSVGNFSFGVISIGALLSCGVISIGSLSAVGVISIGYSHSYGIIAIATGSKDISERYRGGLAFGLIAIGRHARGVYALSYDADGSGTYQFSPKRQDPEAVTIFTRSLKKFKGAFASPS